MIVATLSTASGIGEPALRLLLTILSAYPVALVYHLTLLRPISSKNAAFIRNSYIVGTGLALSYFYNGRDIIHSLITTTVTWLTMWFGDVIDNRKISAIIVFIFNLGYLITGYYFNSTDTYDISWTMTQCILCLRMIGFAMDFMDASSYLKSKKIDQKESKTTALKDKHIFRNGNISPTNLVTKPIVRDPVSFGKDCQLPVLPSFFETIGYAHFFGAFLVGPQFSFSLYKKFITFSIYPNPNNIPSGSYSHALKSFLLGATYLGVAQIGNGVFPMSYLITKEYAAKNLIERLAFMWFAGKFTFSKYLGIWTLVEGACVLSGITFNGYNDHGHAEWNGLANVVKHRFEFATTFTEIIGSFNTNTNLWSKLYIFKRLIFLNNKNISSIATLFFLAIWHGIHPGYFMTFFLEFLDVETEKRWSKRLTPYTTPIYDEKNKSNLIIKLVKRLHLFFCWLGQTSGLHYAMVSFEILKWNNVITAWQNVYYCGHIVVFTLLFLDIILPRQSGKKIKVKRQTDDEVNGLRETKLNGTIDRE
ncbi:hypothetical protein G9A89_020049 [Geosiphon pyriformis]|nr:hypothetical protein G9A89_020049 [Geosiphon pyriformis]